MINEVVKSDPNIADETTSRREIKSKRAGLYKFCMTNDDKEVKQVKFDLIIQKEDERAQPLAFEDKHHHAKKGEHG